MNQDDSGGRLPAGPGRRSRTLLVVVAAIVAAGMGAGTALLLRQNAKPARAPATASAPAAPLALPAGLTELPDLGPLPTGEPAPPPKDCGVSDATIAKLVPRAQRGTTEPEWQQVHSGCSAKSPRWQRMGPGATYVAELKVSFKIQRDGMLNEPSAADASSQIAGYLENEGGLELSGLGEEAVMDYDPDLDGRTTVRFRSGPQLVEVWYQGMLLPKEQDRWLFRSTPISRKKSEAGALKLAAEVAKSLGYTVTNPKLVRQAPDGTAHIPSDPCKAVSAELMKGLGVAGSPFPVSESGFPDSSGGACLWDGTVQLHLDIAEHKKGGNGARRTYLARYLEVREGRSEELSALARPQPPDRFTPLTGLGDQAFAYTFKPLLSTGAAECTVVVYQSGSTLGRASLCGAAGTSRPGAYHAAVALSGRSG